MKRIMIGLVLIILLSTGCSGTQKVAVQAGTITHIDSLIPNNITTIDECLLDKDCRQDFCQEHECFEQNGAWYYALN